MSTDGDLWARAMARGLDRDGGLLIVRPKGASFVLGGRRVFEGECTTFPGFPPSGLYRAEQRDGGFFLHGIDRPADAADVRIAALGELHLEGRALFAIVEQSDPAAHADEQTDPAAEADE